MRNKYLECGKIVSTHGVRGEVRAEPWCDSPDFLCKFKTLYLKKGEEPLAVERSRVNKNMVLLKIKGIDTIDDAAALRGKIIYIDRDDAPNDGRDFIADLIGMTVLDADSGRSWGVLTDVIATGANDVYVLDDGGRQRLIPAIPDVVLETDVAGGTMRIRPLRGLFDDED